MKITIVRLLFLAPAAVVLLGADVTDNMRGDAAQTGNGIAPTATVERTPQPITEPIGQQTPAEADNANYAIDWYSINGGGTVDAASTNYRLGASIGQSVAGAAVSTNYQMGIGFWYGAEAGTCQCDCHGDPGGPCDGFTSILDVTQVVNAAFRNYPPMLDPNASCPYQTPDVNCSGSADVLDVVKMVNVAFRNGNPATEFCDPCP